MLRNVFGRRADSRTVMESADAMTSSHAPAQEYASLGPYYIAQAGPAATRLGSAPTELSPVVRRAAARITGNPVA